MHYEVTTHLLEDAANPLSSRINIKRFAGIDTIKISFKIEESFQFSDDIKKIGKIVDRMMVKAREEHLRKQQNR